MNFTPLFGTFFAVAVVGIGGVVLLVAFLRDRYPEETPLQGSCGGCGCLVVLIIAIVMAKSAQEAYSKECHADDDQYVETIVSTVPAGPTPSPAPTRTPPASPTPTLVMVCGFTAMETMSASNLTRNHAVETAEAAFPAYAESAEHAAVQQLQLTDTRWNGVRQPTTSTSSNDVAWLVTFVPSDASDNQLQVVIDAETGVILLSCAEAAS